MSSFGSDQMNALIETLHGAARVQVALAKMEGNKLDKKVCRFNDLVETAIRYGCCSEEFNEKAAWDGLRDAIDCCIVGDPMYVANKTSLSLVSDWMLGT